MVGATKDRFEEEGLDEDGALTLRRVSLRVPPESETIGSAVSLAWRTNLALGGESPLDPSGSV